MSNLPTPEWTAALIAGLKASDRVAEVDASQAHTRLRPTIWITDTNDSHVGLLLSPHPYDGPAACDEPVETVIASMLDRLDRENAGITGSS